MTNFPKNEIENLETVLDAKERFQTKNNIYLMEQLTHIWSVSLSPAIVSQLCLIEGAPDFCTM
jgi:hypothetical protein